MIKHFTAGLCLAISLAACNQTTTVQNSAGDTTTALETPVSRTSLPAAAPADAPVMHFEKEAYDFGEIKSGEKVTYEFKFTNTGKSPLIISDATATCGCTKPEYNPAPVKPGDQGIVKVTFNSEAKSGMQDKMITVTANTNPAQTMVHLTGEVTPADTK